MVELLGKKFNKISPSFFCLRNHHLVAVTTTSTKLQNLIRNVKNLENLKNETLSLNLE